MLLVLTASSAGGAEAIPHRLDTRAAHRAGDYAFLGSAVGDRPVVALGESIHLTREMPLVRLHLLRYLHERRGMNVLALEGSLIDAWTAQEHAYRSSGPVQDRARRFVHEALFGLWQTEEMVQVIAYALSTQNGPNPLYLASFDLQPGNSRAYGGSSRKSIDAFLAALKSADPQLNEAQTGAWSTALGTALDCDAALPEDRAVAQLERWIDDRAEQVFGATRSAAHLQALRLVPLMIRSRLQHCAKWDAARRSMTVYQRTRDVLNAELALALRRGMPRMLLWAHHSHLHHNSLGRAVPSMGQHLKAALGDDLYTIGVFAGGGTAVDSVRADRASGIGVLLALAPRPVPMNERFGVERRLSALMEDDFFIDLADAPADWARPDFSRLEVEGRMATALSRDFDGALLIHKVTGAELNFLPPLARTAVGAAGWVLQHSIAAASAVSLTVAAAAAVVRALWRRRRRRAPRQV